MNTKDYKPGTLVVTTTKIRRDHAIVPENTRGVIVDGCSDKGEDFRVRFGTDFIVTVKDCEMISTSPVKEDKFSPAGLIALTAAMNAVSPQDGPLLIAALAEESPGRQQLIQSMLDRYAEAVEQLDILLQYV